MGLNKTNTLKEEAQPGCRVRSVMHQGHDYEIHHIKYCFFHRPTTVSSSCFINDLFALWLSTLAGLCGPGNTSLLNALHPAQCLELDGHSPQMWAMTKGDKLAGSPVTILR